jgi:hypothetical protein
MAHFTGFVPPPGPMCMDLGTFTLVVKDYVMDSD